MKGIKSKTEAKRNCGTQVEPPPQNPAQGILSDHREVFSCGGVYLGLNRDTAKLADHFDFVHLPNHAKDVVVLNNQRVHRRPGTYDAPGVLSPSEVSTPEEALRRFFKESLN